MGANVVAGADAETGKHADVTRAIIGAFYRVYNYLGWGFSERVYENALVREIREAGLSVEQQKGLPVFYHGQPVGDYVADLVVEGCVIVELKAVEELGPQHEAQLLSYLRASQIEVGLLLNFGPKAVCKRRVYDNQRKGSLRWLPHPSE